MSWTETLRRTRKSPEPDQEIKRTIVELVNRGKPIEGDVYPYGYGSRGKRQIVPDVVEATGSPADVVGATLAEMLNDGWLVFKKRSWGRFAGALCLKVDWTKVPWEPPSGQQTPGLRPAAYYTAVALDLIEDRIDLEGWRRRFYERLRRAGYSNPETIRSKFQRARRDLLKRGRILEVIERSNELIINITIVRT